MNFDHLLHAAFLILYVACSSPGRTPHCTQIHAPEALRSRFVPTCLTPKRLRFLSLETFILVSFRRKKRAARAMSIYSMHKNEHLVYHFYQFSCVRYGPYYEGVSWVWTIRESIWQSWPLLMDCRRSCLSWCSSCRAPLALRCGLQCPATKVYYFHIPIIFKFVV